MYRREPARQIAVPRHRKARASEPRDQCEERAQARKHRADPHDRRGPRCADGLGGRGDRRAGGGEHGRAGSRQRGNGDDEIQAHRQSERDLDRPWDRPLRLAHFLAEGRNPGVAREGEEEEPGCLKDPVGAPGPERGQAAELAEVCLSARGDRDHDDRQREDRRCNEHSCEAGGARHAAVVDSSERDDRDERKPALQPGRSRDRIGRERQRHRGARRGLADHEPPPGQEAPPLAEALAAVDVRPAGGRVLRCKLRRRDRVAVRDARRDHEADQQSAPGSRRGGAERREDAGADHRAEPDDDGVARSELARERAALRHIASATRVAAAASSSSETFGSTSSQRGSIIPAASTMPSGRGISQTWKCAPPSPQR